MTGLPSPNTYGNTILVETPSPQKALKLSVRINDGQVQHKTALTGPADVQHTYKYLIVPCVSTLPTKYQNAS